MSLESTEAECAAGRTAARVSLSDIENYIERKFERTAAELFLDRRDELKAFETLNVLSICILVMKNGFAVVGKSAPASPENFDAELGRKLAYEDAVRQLWPLMGFSLRDRLMAQKIPNQNP